MTRIETASHIAQIQTDAFLEEFVPLKLSINDEEIAINSILSNISIFDCLAQASGSEPERYCLKMKLAEHAWKGTGLFPCQMSRWDETQSNIEITPNIVVYYSDDDSNSRMPHDVGEENQNTFTAPVPTFIASHYTSTASTASVKPTNMIVSSSVARKSNITHHTEDEVVPYPTFSANSRAPLNEPEEYVTLIDFQGIELIIEETDFKYGDDHQEQIGKYAGQILPHHRCHLLSIATTHNTARFLRWDHSGVIASNPIDFSTKVGLRTFITFLHRFAYMCPRERGHDTTVLNPTAKDLEQLKSFMDNNLPNLPPNHKEFFREAFTDDNWALRIVELKLSDHHRMKEKPLEATGKRIRLLIGAPQEYNDRCFSLFGRATKGFVALDVDKKKLKFLKDTWRYNGASYHPELDVYERLHKHGVKNIATVEGGGDVLDPDPEVARSKWKVQETASHRYIKTDNLVHLPQVHHRLLIRQLGTPMEKYHSSLSLSYYLSIIIAGHRDAWNNANVLHGDISPSNMLICESPEDGVTAAFLVNWDLCRYKEDLNDEPSQKTRSGTWAFKSALTLRYPTKQHEPSDDLESFIHVLHWFCLRFHAHDMTGWPSDITDTLSKVYFTVFREKGYEQCSKQKLKHMLGGTQCFDLTPGQVAQGLIDLVDKLSSLCKQHYATVDMVALNNARSQLLGNQTLATRTHRSDAPASKETDEEESDSDSGDLIEIPGFGRLEVEEKLEAEEEREVKAQLRGKAETRSTSPTTTQLSPFLTHAKILAVFDSMLPKEAKELKKSNIWDMPFSRNSHAVKTDKIADQFNLEIFQDIDIPVEPNLSRPQYSTIKRSS